MSTPSHFCAGDCAGLGGARRHQQNPRLRRLLIHVWPWSLKRIGGELPRPPTSSRFRSLLRYVGVASVLIAAVVNASDGVESKWPGGNSRDAAEGAPLDSEGGSYPIAYPPEDVDSPLPRGSFVVPSPNTDTKSDASVTVELEWYRAVFGAGIGLAGMTVGDLDADGDLEVVLASSGPYRFGSTGFWYALEWDGQNYVHGGTSLPFDEKIQRLRVAQLDRDSALEVAVLIGRHIVVYDGLTLDIEMDIPIQRRYDRDMALGDIDDDGTVEAVLCNEDGTWVYDLVVGGQPPLTFDYPCTRLEIGETDGTPGLEIVLTNGNIRGIVLDGATGALEWDHPLGFGHRFAVGDVDGDSVDEIVAASGGGISVWNGDDHSLGWEVTVDSYMTVTIADVEGDRQLEVVYGDMGLGGVHVLDGQSGAEKYSIENPDYGVTGIAIGDVNRDGIREVFFGSSSGAGGPSYLYAVDTVSQEIEWQSVDFSGPFYGLAHGDIDADGDSELIYTTVESDGGYGGSLFFVHDAAGKRIEFQGPNPAHITWTWLMKVQVADVLGDSALEIFLPTGSTYHGVLQCVDGRTHELWWEIVLDENSNFASLRLGDIEGDGILETVGGIRGQGLHVIAHDAASGAEKWKSPDLEGFFDGRPSLTLLRVADIDDDGTAEILVTHPGADLIALDPVGGTTDLSTTGLRVTALATPDLDGDGVLDIVIGTDDGLLQQVNPVTGDAVTLGGPFGVPVDAVAVAAITEDSVSDFVICAADRVYLIDGATMEPLWVSRDLGTDVGRFDSLIVGDFDLDGRTEIWVNAGMIGHLMFEVVETGGGARWRRVPRGRRLPVRP